MVSYSFNLSMQETEAGICEFETSLVYRDRATQRNPVSTKQRQSYKNKEERKGRTGMDARRAAVRARAGTVAEVTHQ